MNAIYDFREVLLIVKVREFKYEALKIRLTMEVGLYNVYEVPQVNLHVGRS